MRVLKKLERIKETEDYWRRNTIATNYPTVTAIELTNKCNFRCTFCPAFTRKPGFMDADLLRHILKTTRFSDSLVQLHFHGESLLHPQLGEMISLCKDAGLNVGLSTNASLLDEKRSRILIQSKLDTLVLAFDGVSKEIFEKYRKHSKYERVKENILRFLDIKESMGAVTPFTDLHVIKIAEATPLINSFVEFWKDTPVDQITVKSFSTRAGQVDETQALKKDWYFGRRPERHPCRWFWSSVIILWDGRIVPCCHDLQGKIIIGNIRDNTLEEIWNSAKMQALRKAEIEGRHASICENCSEWYGTPPGLFGFVSSAVIERFKRMVGSEHSNHPQIFDVRYRRNGLPTNTANVPFSAD